MEGLEVWLSAAWEDLVTPIDLGRHCTLRVLFTWLPPGPIAYFVFLRCSFQLEQMWGLLYMSVKLYLLGFRVQIVKMNFVSRFCLQSYFLCYVGFVSYSDLTRKWFLYPNLCYLWKIINKNLATVTQLWVYLIIIMSSPYFRVSSTNIIKGQIKRFAEINFYRDYIIPIFNSKIKKEV